MAKTGAALLPPFGLVEESTRFVSLDVPGLKSLFINGLKPGTITRIEGPRSSGRTSLGAHILAQATGRGEICAIVDTRDHLHPESLQAAGVRLDHLVWIRCGGNAEHALRAVDLLLHAGGFGVVWLDLCEVSPQVVNRIPLSYWYRFRRAIEQTATILLLCGDFACAKSSITNILQLESKAIDWMGHAGIAGGVRLVMAAATLQKSPGTCPLFLRAVV